MTDAEKKYIARARLCAVEVLLNNNHGPYRGLPRTAAWGYPEPYTRDMMISGLGFLVSGEDKLVKSFKKVLETTAKNQNRLGHIPSLVHDPDDRGSSDCTPLFLMGVGLYRQFSGDKEFLKDATEKALKWMEYQCPYGGVLVGQLPTSDWRDEQWVLGYGLFVNTVTYAFLKLLGLDERAEILKGEMEHFTIKGERQNQHVHEGLMLRQKPYYALWAYKIYSNERFDLLGNSIAILSGIAPPTRAKNMISWIEDECDSLKKDGYLAVDLPPNFFPYIKQNDPDWIPRYRNFNMPGDYHNGGIWPFVCGFYVAAIVAAGKQSLAEEKLIELAKLVELTREADVDFGFNEWIKAQTGNPMGQDWQSWSAAMFLYAAKCVEEKHAVFFDKIRR